MSEFPEYKNLNENIIGPESEILPTAEIDVSDNEVNIVLKNIKLEDGGKEALGRLLIQGEKVPLNMDKVQALQHVSFSESNPQTEKFIAEVEKLAEIVDERKRIDELLRMLKSKITYGYESVLEEKAIQLGIEKSDLDKLGVKGNSQVPLNEMLEYGVGICGHLSEAYLYLAHKAKLKGVVSHSHTKYPPINIIRTDNSQRLFKSAEVGEETSNHAWVEIELEDGTWIPVDPSTEITGTFAEGMKMFEEARYKSNLAGSVILDFDRNSQLSHRGVDKYDGAVAAGRKDFTIDPEIGLVRRISFGKDEREFSKRQIYEESEKMKIIPMNLLNKIKFVDVKFENS